MIWNKSTPGERTPAQHHYVERKVPQLQTFSFSHQGKRAYQQDAVYVSGSKILSANKKTRVLGMMEWVEWLMVEELQELEYR